MGQWKDKRELIYVDDLANAIVYFFTKTDKNLINIGSGIEKTIHEYAKLYVK